LSGTGQVNIEKLGHKIRDHPDAKDILLYEAAVKMYNEIRNAGSRRSGFFEDLKNEIEQNKAVRDIHFIGYSLGGMIFLLMLLLIFQIIVVFVYCLIVINVEFYIFFKKGLIVMFFIYIILECFCF